MRLRYLMLFEPADPNQIFGGISLRKSFSSCVLHVEREGENYVGYVPREQLQGCCLYMGQERKYLLDRNRILPPQPLHLQVENRHYLMTESAAGDLFLRRYGDGFAGQEVCFPYAPDIPRLFEITGNKAASAPTLTLMAGNVPDNPNAYWEPEIVPIDIDLEANNYNHAMEGLLNYAQERPFTIVPVWELQDEKRFKLLKTYVDNCLAERGAAFSKVHNLMFGSGVRNQWLPFQCLDVLGGVFKIAHDGKKRFYKSLPKPNVEQRLWEMYINYWTERWGGEWEGHDANFQYLEFPQKFRQMQNDAPRLGPYCFEGKYDGSAGVFFEQWAWAQPSRVVAFLKQAFQGDTDTWHQRFVYFEGENGFLIDSVRLMDFVARRFFAPRSRVCVELPRKIQTLNGEREFPISAGENGPCNDNDERLRQARYVPPEGRVHVDLLESFERGLQRFLERMLYPTEEHCVQIKANEAWPFAFRNRLFSVAWDAELVFEEGEQGFSLGEGRLGDRIGKTPQIYDFRQSPWLAAQ